MPRAAEWPSMPNVLYDEEIPDMIRVYLGGVGQGSPVQSNGPTLGTSGPIFRNSIEVAAMIYHLSIPVP